MVGKETKWALWTAGIAGAGCSAWLLRSYLARRTADEVHVDVEETLTFRTQRGQWGDVAEVHLEGAIVVRANFAHPTRCRLKLKRMDAAGGTRTGVDTLRDGEALKGLSLRLHPIVDADFYAESGHIVFVPDQVGRFDVIQYSVPNLHVVEPANAPRAPNVQVRESCWMVGAGNVTLSCTVAAIGAADAITVKFPVHPNTQWSYAGRDSVELVDGELCWSVGSVAETAASAEVPMIFSIEIVLRDVTTAPSAGNVDYFATVPNTHLRKSVVGLAVRSLTCDTRPPGIPMNPSQDGSRRSVEKWLRTVVRHVVPFDTVNLGSAPS